jgi:mRNA interferase MazF
MVISQGDICWAELGPPRGSRAGYRRPVVVVQGDRLNRSRVSTVIVVPLTSNTKWGTAPGNVLLQARATGLPKDSVANVSLVTHITRDDLVERVGKLSASRLAEVLAGLDIVLGR